MKILQRKITETQTSFSTKFGDKEFHTVFPFYLSASTAARSYIYFHSSYLYNYYN
jgi:hypothetical protein